VAAGDAAARVVEGYHTRGDTGGINGGGLTFLFFTEEKKMGARGWESNPRRRSTAPCGCGCGEERLKAAREARITHGIVSIGFSLGILLTLDFNRDEFLDVFFGVHNG
jgi:hypothetical protein